jgi:hypothetical protein
MSSVVLPWLQDPKAAAASVAAAAAVQGVVLVLSRPHLLLQLWQLQWQFFDNSLTIFLDSRFLFVLQLSHFVIFSDFLLLSCNRISFVFLILLELFCSDLSFCSPTKFVFPSSFSPTNVFSVESESYIDVDYVG